MITVGFLIASPDFLAPLEDDLYNGSLLLIEMSPMACEISLVKLVDSALILLLALLRLLLSREPLGLYLEMSICVLFTGLLSIVFCCLRFFWYKS